MTTVILDRPRLERRARMLAWGGNAWHGVEFLIAVAAGVAASSVALVAFGIDSLIELAAGGVIVWLFSGGRGESETAERRAQVLIAVSFFALAAYVAFDSVRAFTGTHPEVSYVGIGLALVTAPTMPLLARAKRRLGCDAVRPLTCARLEPPPAIRLPCLRMQGAPSLFWSILINYELCSVRHLARAAPADAPWARCLAFLLSALAAFCASFAASWSSRSWWARSADCCPHSQDSGSFACR